MTSFFFFFSFLSFLQYKQAILAYAILLKTENDKVFLSAFVCVLCIFPVFPFYSFERKDAL